MKDCPSCYAAPARRHPTLGLLPCDECQNRHNKLPSPNLPVEITPEYIKSERKERQSSIEQPHYKGELNKAWVDLWGEKAAKEHGFSDKEIKNAQYVMDGVPEIRYYKDGEQLR